MEIEKFKRRLDAIPDSVPKKSKSPDKYSYNENDILKTATIDPNYLNATIHDFEFEPVMNNQYGLYISGPTGVGKTHYSWGLFKRILIDNLMGQDHITSPSILRNNIDNYCHFVKAYDIMFKLYACFEGKGTQGAVIDQFSRFPFLIIDDLAAQRETEFYFETFLKIIDYRTSALKPTIINSNLPPGEVYRKNERLSSRLSQFATLSVSGIDRRKNNNSA